jgi:hypothetical protein
VFHQELPGKYEIKALLARAGICKDGTVWQASQFNFPRKVGLLKYIRIGSQGRRHLSSLRRQGSSDVLHTKRRVACGRWIPAYVGIVDVSLWLTP